MGGQVDLKNVPTGAWVFASIALVSILGAFVFMGSQGADTSELRWVVLTVLNVGGNLAAVGGLVYAGAAARQSQVAVEQTNGALDARIAAGVTAALDRQRTEDTGQPAPFRAGGPI